MEDKSYLVKSATGEADEEDLTVKHDELTLKIRIIVREFAKKGEPTQVSDILVDINSKISDSLGETVDADPFLCDGKLVDKEDTFSSLRILPNTVILCGSGGKVEPIMWKRSKNHQLNSYNSVSRNYEDAVCFVPRRDVLICGFMWGSEWYKKDFKLLIHWKVTDEGEASEWHEFSSTDDRAEGEWKLHRFDF